MYKLKQMSSVWLIKTIATGYLDWNLRFFPCKYLNKDSKIGLAEPFVQFPVLKYPFQNFSKKDRINFHILLQNPGSNSKTLRAIPKPWEQLQNPGSTPKPWDQFQNFESSHPSGLPPSVASEGRAEGVNDYVSPV